MNSSVLPQANQLGEVEHPASRSNDTNTTFSNSHSERIAIQPYVFGAAVADPSYPSASPINDRSVWSVRSVRSGDPLNRFFVSRGCKQPSVLDSIGAQPIDIARKLTQWDEETYRDVLNTTPLNACIWDENMKYVACNDAWCNAFGLSASTILDECHYNIFDDLPETYLREHQRCLNGEELHSLDELYQRQDGRVYHFSWTNIPMKSKRGKIGGMICVSRIKQLVISPIADGQPLIRDPHLVTHALRHHQMLQSQIDQSA